MKLNYLYEAILTESMHTTIFVDFDETIGHVDPKKVDDGIEVIEVGAQKVAMRHGWREFLHALNNLEHAGNIMIYSGGGAQLTFPILNKIYDDLGFINMLTKENIEKYVASHPHSILVDENMSQKYTIYKLKRIGLTEDNLVTVTPFRGQMDNELSKAFNDVKQKIKNLEEKHR